MTATAVALEKSPELASRIVAGEHVVAAIGGHEERAGNAVLALAGLEGARALGRGAIAEEPVVLAREDAEGLLGSGRRESTRAAPTGHLRSTRPCAVQPGIDGA